MPGIVPTASALTRILRERIQNGGPISFEGFMEAALYHPVHGYYTSGRVSIGRQGDFFTNVSVGPLYGRLLARQFVEMWEYLGRPFRFTIIEQGAHDGHFAHDALAGLQEFSPECFTATRYVIVEPSDALRDLQKQRLAEFGPVTVHWRASMDAIPAVQCVHFSNELPDAFPVHRVVKRGETWNERWVDWRDGDFSFVDGPPVRETLAKHLAKIPPVADGTETEVNLAALEWVESVSHKIARGWLLMVDYGYPIAEYYSNARPNGTLSAYAHHRRIDNVLGNPGECDLTAHVDFTSIAKQGEASGLKVCGFTDQHHFTVGLSKLHFTDQASITREMEKELREFKTLMHPNMMGASFKALAFVRDNLEKLPALSAFQFGGDPRAVLGLE
jgi:SAM-dependent MidA family methyltransferase